MPDVFSPSKRSAVMSRIRSQGNRDTELVLIRFFRAHGITGWRRRQKLFGKPDFVFRSARLAVFVDGCFWHGCPKHCRRPTGNRAFWGAKLDRNQARDRLVNRTLRRDGWQVLRIWEHELARKNEQRLLRRLVRALENGPEMAAKPVRKGTP
jgi:DNA mismatch endonuclease (patch repair protein)